MGCFASKPVAYAPQPSPRQPPPPTGVPQQTQSRGENIELRQSYGASPPPVSPPRGPDATAVPVKSVPTDESIPAPNPPQSDRQPSQNPPPRSNRPDRPPVSPGISRATSAPASIGGWRASEGAMSWDPLPESGSLNFSSHLRTIYRSASMDAYHNAIYRAPRAPPSSFGHGGHIGIDLDSRARPRADPKRAATTLATTGNNSRSFLPTVREVLPDGFRYVLRP